MLRTLFSFAAAACMFLPSALKADQGETSASFLKLATGPRAIAMGEAFTGLADDVNAIRYNSAGTAFLTQTEVTFMHAVWFQDIFYDHGALAVPIKDIGTVGLEIFYLNAGKFEKYTYDSAGNPQQQGDFSAGAMAGGLSFARPILDSLSAGLVVKYLSETIDGQGSSGFAVDLGALYKTPFPGLSAGFNVRNLGPSMGYQQAYKLPTQTSFGVGYKPMKDVAVTCDYAQPIETAGILSVGGEYGYREFLFIRGGYRFQGSFDYNQTQSGYGPEAASGLSLGMGIKVSMFSVDYAWCNYGFLGTSHRISLGAKFK